MKQPQKVVLYARVSSKKQLSNASLPTQLTEMRRWAVREGYEVARVFEERGKSAKTANRPALQDMLRWIAAHPGEIVAVLVYDFNRIARNAIDHLTIRATLKSRKVDLVSVTQPVSQDYHGKLIETIFAGVAEHDNSLRAERSRVGMISAVGRGRWCHQAPVGYINGGPNAVPSLRPDPGRADVVSSVFARIGAGEGPLDVYEELVARGFGTRRGGPLGRQTFYSMLRNPAYKGQLVTTLGVGDGDWEPLVESAVWERVQTVVSRVGHRGPGQKGRPSGKRAYRRVREGFELRGFLRCAVCGLKTTGGITKRYAYMSCPQGHVRARAEVLSGRFCEWLTSVRPGQVLLRKLEAAIRKELDAQHRLLSQRRGKQQRFASGISAKLRNLNDALADGTMDRGAYRETYLRLKSELQAVEDAGVEDRLEQLDVDVMLQFAGRLLAQPARWWRNATAEEKIQLQRALFPHGLLVDETLNFSTDPSHNDSMTYLLFGANEDGMASPTGTETQGSLEFYRLFRAA